MTLEETILLCTHSSIIYLICNFRVFGCEGSTVITLGTLFRQLAMPAALSSGSTAGGIVPLSCFQVAFFPLAGKWSKLQWSALELLTMASILRCRSASKRRGISEEALPYPQVQVSD